jgi:Zn ribbon nucleic-acid-binding protein
MEWRKEDHMCSTCRALDVVEKYREQQFLVATCVVSRRCGKLGAEEIIEEVMKKNEFGV